MSPMHDTPLNPSMASTMGQGFDPISSMAQMSQQLSVSSASGPPQGGPPDCNMDAGMMNMGRPNGMPGGPGGPMGPGDMMGGPPGGLHDMGDPRMMGKTLLKAIFYYYFVTFELKKVFTQLTNKKFVKSTLVFYNVSGPGGPGGPPPGMMGPGPRGPPHPGMRPGFPPMMGPGGPGGPMGPNPGDNRMLVPNSGDKSSTNPTFATVKASAPNTIQYLPTRPQYDSRPRGPPSLEFLQRFANPDKNSMDGGGGPGGPPPHMMGGPGPGGMMGGPMNNSPGMDPRMMGPGGPNGPMDPRMMGPGGPNGPMDPRMMGPGGPGGPMNPRMGDPRMMGKTL